MQFGYRLIGDMGHIPLLLFQEDPASSTFRRDFYLLDRYSIDLERMVRLIQTAQFRP
jgi:hypothetical protein